MPRKEDASRGRRAPIDYEALALDLAALAYPARLELLDSLDVPRVLSEVRLRPRRVEDGGNPDRPAAKQTVAAHLDKLREAGLLATGVTERAGKQLTTYRANPQRLYAVSEEVRRLVVRRAGSGAGSDATGTLQDGARPVPGAGPRLVLVHGAYEGRPFPLAGRATRWVIGRRVGLDVSLDYDPYVSTENAAVTLGPDGAHHIEDLDSKNGTHVNWSHLAPGDRAPLRHGDVVGVGRSMLVYYLS